MGSKNSKTKEIEKQIEIEQEQEKENAKKLKFLISGIRGSGKSTVFKTFDMEYCLSKKEENIEIIRNLSLSILTDFAENENIQFKNEENQEIYKKLIETREINPEKISKLWKSEEMQSIYQKKPDILDPSSIYLLNEIERIFQPNYSPTKEDVLRYYQKTVGINVYEKKIQNFPIVIRDIWSRGERRKWMRYFENMDVIIHCVDLSCYYQNSYADESINKMQESIELFDEIINYQWFSETPFILVFTKLDLFLKNLEKNNFHHYFPDYNGKKGKNEPNEIKEYIEKRFISLNQNQERKIQIHYVNLLEEYDSNKLWNEILITGIERKFGKEASNLYKFSIYGVIFDLINFLKKQELCDKIYKTNDSQEIGIHSLFIEQRIGNEQMKK
ncbi:gtp-binding protein alpha subunit [Anaeramoeba ignava]|uniref:Gtp-binding protein alpha subunit n=1 Tax=Anaeramoeba ignava TaxID=1746090 RepID=A0A9Q0LJ13_ANAIG|nr:gtp-binding protein alpha subunit [Anaeramoeba ignava]